MRGRVSSGWSTEMTRSLSLYNTWSRSVEPFEPVGGTVGLYCCGPTVYNYAHIGNLRTYVNEDLLRRTLEAAGYAVKHVMNVTDVGHLTSDADEGEDKMVSGARREGKSVWEIARFYEEAFFRDADALGIVRPHVVCRATEHIGDMIELVKRIEANGFTYVVDGNVYFDIGKFPRYAALSRQTLEQLRAGARVEVDVAKRDALDFVLWFTRSKFGNQDMQWDSPWGRGFPGWHLECSAMSMKYLGEQIDIHCGGVDHVPVHHTNEIAQSEAATGKHPWVKHWVHNEFMVFNHGKMSKSSGEFLTLESVRQRGIDPLAYRLFCFSAHYRSQLSFSWDGIESSGHTLGRLRGLVPAEAGGGVPAEEVDRATAPFWKALSEDINAPRALAVVWDVLRDQTLAPALRRACAGEFERVLGLGLPPGADIEAIATKVAGRASARRARDFAAADSIRAELAAMGMSVKDLPDGGAEVVCAGAQG